MSRRYPKSSSIRKRRGQPRRIEKQALAEAGCDDWLVRLPSPRPSDNLRMVKRDQMGSSHWWNAE